MKKLLLIGLLSVAASNLCSFTEKITCKQCDDIAKVIRFYHENDKQLKNKSMVEAETAGKIKTFLESEFQKYVYQQAVDFLKTSELVELVDGKPSANDLKLLFETCKWPQQLNYAKTEFLYENRKESNRVQ